MNLHPVLSTNSDSLPVVNDLRSQLAEAVSAWLTRSPSLETRSGYSRDLNRFLRHIGFADGAWDELPKIRPGHVAAWRDHLLEIGQTSTAISRKLSVIRSLFGYLRAYGYAGANPADTAFVATPPVPRDGKTVGLTPEDCRRLLDAPSFDTPEGVRDRALLAVLAYTGCRVGEVCRLRIEDYKSSSGHWVLEVRGKGGKERRVPLHSEAVERLEAWLDVGSLRESTGALFRPSVAARGHGVHGFRGTAMTRRAIQLLVERYVARLKLDLNVTVHSFRVTALTTARERGADLVDLQDLAGYGEVSITGVMESPTVCGVRTHFSHKSSDVTRNHRHNDFASSPCPLVASR